MHRDRICAGTTNENGCRKKLDSAASGAPGDGSKNDLTSSVWSRRVQCDVVPASRREDAEIEDWTCQSSGRMAEDSGTRIEPDAGVTN